MGGHENRAMDILKPVVKSVDMKDDMRIYAEKVAMDAVGLYTVEEDVAGHIKKEFNLNYEPCWHVFVGRRFGSYITHETKKYVFMSVGNLYVLIYKCGEEFPVDA